MVDNTLDYVVIFFINTSEFHVNFHNRVRHVYRKYKIQKKENTLYLIYNDRPFIIYKLTHMLLRHLFTISFLLGGLTFSEFYRSISNNTHRTTVSCLVGGQDKHAWWEYRCQ